jgi:hypothetical protein
MLQTQEARAERRALSELVQQSWKMIAATK